MRMPGGHPHIAARVKFHGMRDLTFRCLECGGEACPPWTTYSLCAAERDAILSVDDEGFAARSQHGIPDGTHTEERIVFAKIR